ncbi:MAG: phosphate regulon sensor histidine kinase PhoR [Pseudomonadota bacterium]|nr:phosphate regulon sensor histidine kinase PhoR [Pseudomonadota bacterium]
MGWGLARSLKALLLVVLGAAVGGVIGLLTHPLLPVPFALLGAALMLVALVLRDAWRGQSLMSWLRGPQSTQAPRDTGFWGELAYRIERELRAREGSIRDEQQRLAQFLSAIEASPNGVLMLDGSDSIDWCNSVAAQHFGLDPVRDLRQRVTNLVRMPAFVALLQGGRFDETVVFSGPLGRTTLSVVIRPYGQSKKLVLSQDVTEQERAEAMRRDFVANVSHEIRTPLTVLAGFVETLTRLKLTDAENSRILELMQQQTNRMQTLVGDLLTLAKLEGSPPPGADRWLPVAEMLQRARAEALALSAGRHVVELNEPIDAEVAGSEAEIYSAVTNLLNNAVRYTAAGGRIDVRWHWRADGGGSLEISDSGLGIAREHLPRLTERFYRVDGSRSRDTGGTGLGLSIVKHVAQRHGGEVELHSELGKGSSFRIVFPALRVRQAPPEALAQGDVVREVARR